MFSIPRLTTMVSKTCTFRDLVPLVVDVTRVDECRSRRDDGGDQTCQSTPDGAGHDIIAPGRDIVPVVSCLASPLDRRSASG